MKTVVLALIFLSVVAFAGEKTKSSKQEPTENPNYQLRYEREVSSLPASVRLQPAKLEASVAPERQLVINTPIGGFWLLAPETSQTAFDSCRPNRANYPTDPFSAR